MTQLPDRVIARISRPRSQTRIWCLAARRHRRNAPLGAEPRSRWNCREPGPSQQKAAHPISSTRKILCEGGFLNVASGVSSVGEACPVLKRQSGTLRLRRPLQLSNFPRISLTRLGFAFPFESFITWPFRKLMAAALPAR
jgi:hypothetical protein